MSEKLHAENSSLVFIEFEVSTSSIEKWHLKAKLKSLPTISGCLSDHFIHAAFRRLDLQKELD